LKKLRLDVLRKEAKEKTENAKKQNKMTLVDLERMQKTCGNTDLWFLCRPLGLYEKADVSHQAGRWWWLGLGFWLGWGYGSEKILESHFWCPWRCLSKCHLYPESLPFQGWKSDASRGSEGVKFSHELETRKREKEIPYTTKKESA